MEEKKRKTKKKQKKKYAGLWEKFRKGSEKSLHNIQEFSRNVLGTEIATGDVWYYISEIQIATEEATSLAKVEKQIVTALKSNFKKISSRLVLDAELKLKVTAEIDNRIGIFCHLAKDLTASKTMSLVGKIIFLNHRIYQEKLIIVLIGTKTEKKKTLVGELEEILNEQNITFCYLETV
ncbi:MAG: hypothetical protein ACPG5B_09025 [Chitinophagales bacterium]